MTTDNRNNQTGPITEADLHAYVDGWLSPERRIEVEQFCAENPEAAEKVDSYQQLNRMLHERFDNVLLEEIPPRILAAKPERGYPRVALRIAAAMGWIALGSLIGWGLRGEIATTPASKQLAADASDFVKHAMYAHRVYAPDAKHPVEVKAEQQAHLAKWLSNRFGEKILVPDLLSTGYYLVGGRLLPNYHGGLAAQFMYEDDDGDRCTLYIITGVSKQIDQFRFTQVADTRAFYWTDNRFSFVMAGEVEKHRLLDMAKLARHQYQHRKLSRLY